MRYNKIDTSSGQVFYEDTKKNTMYTKEDGDKPILLESTPGAFYKFRRDIKKITKVNYI